MTYTVVVIHPVTGSEVLPLEFGSRAEAIVAAENLAREERAMVLVDRDEDGECQFVAMPPSVLMPIIPRQLPFALGDLVN